LSSVRTLVSAALLLCAAAVASAAAPKSTTPPEKKRPAAAKAAPAKNTSVVVVREGNGALRRVALVRIEPVHPSFGQLSGLHNEVDALELKSGVALVLDQDTNEVLFSKNAQAVLPIASITKLMTAVVVTEANLPLDEMITITDDDIDTEKGSRSRLKVGTTLARDMLHLA
jgi:D-alanyl-D-alanine endopeptidase (penicillin-binding protein 7)